MLKGKLDLLSNTNMVDFAMDVHKSLYPDQEVPASMSNFQRLKMSIYIIQVRDFDGMISCEIPGNSHFLRNTQGCSHLHILFSEKMA